MTRQAALSHVKLGLALVLAGLLFGIGMGVSFGINEDAYKDAIAAQVAAHPELHDDRSRDKIWRYAQRAHFHATGIAAFSIGLILLVTASSLKRRLKTMSALLIGLGSCYPLAWFTMYRLAPTIGRTPAHDHILTWLFTTSASAACWPACSSWWPTCASACSVNRPPENSENRGQTTFFFASL